MKIYELATITPADLQTILDRSTRTIFDPETLATVRAIYDDVRERGDRALVEILARYDGVETTPDHLQIAPAEFDDAERTISSDVRDAIQASIAAVRRYNERLLRDASWFEELAPGVTLGEKSTPIDRVGIYVPCGKGSFPSVMVQLATPAVVAGVREIAVVLPPTPGAGGAVDAAVLVAARLLGIERVYRANGPAGIAALALGTETIGRVRLIVGPGSPAVTTAKILAQLEGVASPMLYGPSECLILADETADPALVASDFLTEAEHGHDSAALLITPSSALIEQVVVEVDRQLALLPEPRRSYAHSATTRYGGAIVTRDIEEAAAFADRYAPEHMQIATRDPRATLALIHNAGEILLGQSTPIAAANFAIGVPATLPTGGYAHASSAITAHTFTKRTSLAEVTPSALQGMTATSIALAAHEGFPQHEAAIHMRVRP